MGSFPDPGLASAQAETQGPDNGTPVFRPPLGLFSGAHLLEAVELVSKQIQIR